MEAGSKILEIPEVFQGRWGIAAKDCTSTMGDAKGLLTISDKQLDFYESRATQEKVLERSADQLKADFAFTGEGMQWTRRIVFDLADNGNTLFRHDLADQDAPESQLRYIRCAKSV